MKRSRKPYVIEEDFASICELCGKKFQFGHNVYDGKHISAYKLLVCSTCYSGNWDGWGPIREGAFVAHMESKGIPLPARNKLGLYPRGE